MLLHDLESVFVHVPKTGWQSIEQFFLNHLSILEKGKGDFLLKKNKNTSLGPPRLAHLTINQYLSLGYLESENFEKYYKFWFVRNPWSRCVSLYKFMWYSAIMSFDSFLEKELVKLVESGNWFYMSQYLYLYNSDEKCGVDFIWRFERLDDDFAQICEALSIPYNWSLPHINSTKHKTRPPFRKGVKLICCDPSRLQRLNLKSWLESTKKSDYKSYYSEKGKNLVKEIYSKDIRFFNYDF